MRLTEFLFGSSTTGPVSDLGLLALRLYTGLALSLAHGLGKLPPAPRFVEGIAGFGFPAPGLFAWFSGFAETFGGLLLAAGLLSRPAAIAIMINMSVALLFAHAGDPFDRRELPLFFFMSALLFLFVGAGRYSLDALIRRTDTR